MIVYLIHACVAGIMQVLLSDALGKGDSVCTLSRDFCWPSLAEAKAQLAIASCYSLRTMWPLTL